MCNVNNLLLEIVKCENVDKVYNTIKCDCEKIVNRQRNNGISLSDFKGPEAWNGQIDVSKILIISSNPSIGQYEVIPDRKWNNLKTIDFYHNRFCKSKNWVKNLGGLRIDGTYGNKVSNWVQTVNNMEYLFGKGVKIGVDYTLLELVHCKSIGEFGVKKAIKECTDKYFDRILDISPAKILIFTGSYAIDFVCKKYNITKRTLNDGFGLYPPLNIGDRDRLIILLPHTNHRGKRKAEYFITEDERKTINDFLKLNFRDPLKVEKVDI